MTDPLSHSESAPQTERLIQVPLEDLKLAPNAPKNIQAPQALVESIAVYGVLQPLLVRPNADGYEVVAGFKRWAAAREAELKVIPVRVYRVEDEALIGLYDASNVRSEVRHKVSVPSIGEYKPSGKLGGLLEEEFNRAPQHVPYKSIMTVAAVVLLAIWGGLALKKRLPERKPKTEITATPMPSSSGRSVPNPTDNNGPTRPNRVEVARWQTLFASVDGVEVRNESGVPRIVFSDPVFSSLTTIDPAQKARLEKVLRLVVQTNPSAVLTVIGHTDNDPIRPSSIYRSNMYLSELRAGEVVKFLKQTGIVSDGQLRPVGVGAEEAPFPNTSAASKTKNRTVSIEIMQPAN